MEIDALSTEYFPRITSGKLGSEMAAELFMCKGLTPGMLVRLERTRRGWRQVDLAQVADVTQAEVSALERGRYVIPGVRRVILQALDLDIEEGQGQ